MIRMKRIQKRRKYNSNGMIENSNYIKKKKRKRTNAKSNRRGKVYALSGMLEVVGEEGECAHRAIHVDFNCDCCAISPAF